MGRLFTVRVAVVGTAEIEVEADTREEAMERAEDCACVFHADEFFYFSEDVIEEEPVA